MSKSKTCLKRDETAQEHRCRANACIQIQNCRAAYIMGVKRVSGSIDAMKSSHRKAMPRAYELKQGTGLSSGCNLNGKLV